MGTSGPDNEEPDPGDEPGQPNESSDPTEPKPAGANPLEALFAQLGLTSGGSPADFGVIMNKMQQTMASMSSLFTTGDTPGGANWDFAKTTARQQCAAAGSDPTPTKTVVSEIRQAIDIAEQWLDPAMTFARTEQSPKIWSRAEWIEQTMPTWQQLVEPVATKVSDSMAAMAESSTAELAPEERSQLGGLESFLGPMLRSSSKSIFSLQFGQGLGKLATEIIGATDIGFPLVDGTALVPTNIAAFASGLDQSRTDVTVYLTLREVARQRLFQAAAWLRPHVFNLVAAHSRLIVIEPSVIEETLNRVDLEDPNTFGTAIQQDMFRPASTPEQRAVLSQLETVLALVEGWVDDVVAEATKQWMPAAGALAETVRRRRVAGGPAEQTFATLVGLQLRPRRLRDAANLWAAVRAERGLAGRDALWQHPDLIPTAADLDDPLGFVSADADRPEPGMNPDAFAAELSRMLDAEEKMDAVDSTSPEPPKPQQPEPDSDT